MKSIKVINTFYNSELLNMYGVIDETILKTLEQLIIDIAVNEMFDKPKDIKIVCNLAGDSLEDYSEVNFTFTETDRDREYDCWCETKGYYYCLCYDKYIRDFEEKISDFLNRFY